VTDHDVAVDPVDDPVADLGPGRAGGHHVGVDAVQGGVESVELAERRWRPDERLGLGDHLAVADLDQAHRAR